MPSAASSGSSKPPEPLTYFLDESLGDSVAATLRAAGAKVIRLTERFARGVADEIWLAEAGNSGWIVMTRDKRIRYRQIEHLALQAARVRAFVFTGGKVTAKDTGAILAAALPRIERICRAKPGPFIYHIGQSGKPIKMA